MINTYSTVDVNGGYFEIRMDIEWLRKAFESSDGLESLIKHFLDTASYLTAQMLAHNTLKGRENDVRNKS